MCMNRGLPAPHLADRRQLLHTPLYASFSYVVYFYSPFCILLHLLYFVVTVEMALTVKPQNSRFQRHVSFDNFSGVEPIDDKNTLSFTLNVRHKGYQYKRRSRTFMVGVDENTYSDYALQWMLDELVDDGDQIVCLRVIEGGSKISSDRALEAKQYQDEAFALMEGIQKKNDDNRAISIVLEFAVGKLQTTFQKMVSGLCLAFTTRLRTPILITWGTRLSFTNLEC